VEEPVKLPVVGEGAAAEDPHGMRYDNPLFFDAQRLKSELHRVFEICNGCRLCFHLCTSFAVMLNTIDERDPHRAEAEERTSATPRWSRSTRRTPLSAGVRRSLAGDLAEEA